MFLHVFLGDYRYYRTYCRKYYAVAAKKEIPAYQGVLDANGKPEQEWVEGDSGDTQYIRLKYGDGRLFRYRVTAAGAPEFCSIEITGPEYRFGRKKIGIGTGKEVIEQAYKNSYISLHYDGKRDSYYAEDGKCYLIFCFDKEDKVSKMTIATPPVYHEMSGWKRREGSSRRLQKIRRKDYE